ncbi:alpha-mannosidase 2-like [Anopheles albimanus]|uniref:Glycoside hydrolase family 38 N-terminal domain-containing protein n=1 Tax=Anopheles albimanus TaxID=7167 RepID=A0A182FA33_ANOAL|nr:alpha-mannosidase 2-like [Anopheles albimanus]
MKTKEYWDKDFESRYEKLQKDPKRPPPKIVVVPHSHNDPGWLKTFVNYFQSDSRQILNLAVTKMPEYSNMSFIWSEISFLQLWWDQAHSSKQQEHKLLPILGVKLGSIDSMVLYDLEQLNDFGRQTIT